MAARAFPSTLPRHLECGNASQVQENTVDGIERRTVRHTDCPGVIVERVMQVTTDRLLWVQVRSDDPATANRVLDSVRTSGL